MISTQINVIKGLYSNIDTQNLIEKINVEELEQVNNYYELIYMSIPVRVFLDLDCKLSDDYYNSFTETTFKNYVDKIEKKLCELKDVSIMNSSRLESKKISFRITYINEYVNTIFDMKKLVVESYYPDIKPLFDAINVELKLSTNCPKFNVINVDLQPYRRGKMRCVNSYKDGDKTRINRLVKGNIIDTVITYIPKEAGLQVLEEESEEEEEEKPKSNNKIIEEIRNKVIKIGNPHFDGYDDWLRLCFIIYNETNGSEEGKELFIELSREVCSNFNKIECNKKWYSIKPTSSTNKIRLPSLIQKYNEMFPEEKNKINDAYQKQKIEFEKRIFKLDNPFKYVKINKDNSLEFLEEPKLKNWSKTETDKIDTVDSKGKAKQTNFIDLWLEDKQQRKHNKIIFDPSTLENGEDYNCWTGFKHKNYEVNNFVEADSKFLKLLKRVVNDDINYEYVKQWIAHIIQKPYIKTKVAIILYSETKGIGKNCIVDGINKLLEGYTAKVEDIEDITKNFNSHLVNKLFITGDEICAKARKVADRLKETITRTTQNLEKKGVDSIQIADYTNWFFTTNNYDAFYVEEGDRRLNLIKCLEQKFLQSEEYYEEINNSNKMADLFNYFRTYKITYKIGTSAELPTTTYKKNLQFNNKAGYIQALYKQPQIYKECKLTVNEFIKISNEYCKSNHIRTTTDSITIGKFLTHIFGDYKKRTTTGYIYNISKLTFNELNKILYDYDKEYYNYVNNLEEGDIPDFSNQ
jgi:hypothetical protein